ncbi:MAG TPA: hypothetical protein GXX29_10685 [Firmicutes bacterium]|nr:hypothetical protein [Bacillota bacterium]
MAISLKLCRSQEITDGKMLIELKLAKGGSAFISPQQTPGHTKEKGALFRRQETAGGRPGARTRLTSALLYFNKPCLTKYHRKKLMENQYKLIRNRPRPLFCSGDNFFLSVMFIAVVKRVANMMDEPNRVPKNSMSMALTFRSPLSSVKASIDQRQSYHHDQGKPTFFHSVFLPKLTGGWTVSKLTEDLRPGKDRMG